MEEKVLNTNEFLTPREAGVLVGYTPDYISKLCRDGAVISKRDERGWLVQKDSLTAFVKNLKIEEEKRREALRQQRAEEYRTSRGLISVKEAGKSVNYTPDYVSKLCREGLVSCERSGREWLVDLASLKKFAEIKKAEEASRLLLLSGQRSEAYAQNTKKSGLALFAFPTKKKNSHPSLLASTLAGLSVFLVAFLIVYLSMFSAIPFGNIARWFKSDVATTTPAVQGAPVAGQPGSVVNNYTTNNNTYNNTNNEYVTLQTVGVSEERLATELQKFKNSTFSEIYGALANLDRGVSGNTISIQHTNRIDQLASVNISGSDFTGGNISNTTLSGITINSGSATFDGTFKVTGTATSTFSNGIDLTDGCFAIDGVCIGSGSGNGTVTTGTIGQVAYYSTSSSEVSGTSTLFIAPTQKIGIGTTSPLSLLDVFGNAILSGANRYLNFGDATSTAGYGIRDNSGVIEFKNNAGSWAALSAGGGSSDSNWTFFNNSGVRFATSTNQLLLGANATTSSTAVLEVAGSALVRGALTSYGLITGSYFSATSTASSTFAGGIESLIQLGIGSTATTTIRGNNATSTFAGGIDTAKVKTTATSTFAGLEIPTGGLKLASLSGVLRATAGAVANGLVDLANDISGILAVANGGTGVSSLSDILGTTNQLTVSNGAGRVIGGNVTLSLPSLLAIQNASSTAQSVLDYIAVGRTATTTIFGDNATSTFSGGILSTRLNTSATSTLAGLEIPTGGLRLGVLSGFLKATAGAVGTSLIDLTADVTGTLPVANGGTNATSQTTNGVNYFNGTSITSGTGLTFDGTKLGVGTTSPYAKLSVVGEIVGAYFTGTTTATSSLGGGLLATRLNTTGTSTMAGIELTSGCFRDSSGACIVSNASGLGGTGLANRAAFWSGATTLSYDDGFTWDNTNKRLGIGTTSPYTALGVAGTVVANNFIGTTTATSSFGAGEFVFDAVANFIGSGASSILDSVGTYFNSTDQTFTLYSNTTNRAGDIELGSTGNSAGVANAFGRVKFFQGSDMLSAIVSYRTAAGADAGQLSFLTQATGGSPQERLVIDPEGNVGIGSTTPFAKLGITNTGSGLSFLVEDDTSPDTSPFAIDASGKVGIGTLAPSVKLHIVDSMSGELSERIENQGTAAGSNAALRIITNGGSAGDPYTSFGNGVIDWALGLDNSDNDSFKISQSSALGTNDFFVVTSTGRVGIASTSPWRALSVEGSSDLGNNALAGYFTGTTTATSSLAGGLLATRFNSTATSTFAGLEIPTGGLKLGALSGFLKATAGAVSTALLDLTTDVTGVLPVANGGTGATSLADLITLGTHTTGNYIATVSGTTNQITVSGSGSENAAVTLSLPTLLAFTNASSTAQSILDYLAIGRTATTTIRGDNSTSTFSGGILATRFNSTGTSTLAGIELTSGCFRDSSGACLVSAGFVGSGATNKVGYWSDATTLTQNANFHFDPTNVRLGVGTSSPFATLSIQGAAYISDTLTAGNITATGTLVASGTGTSTIAGGFTVGSSDLVVDPVGNFIGRGLATALDTVGTYFNGQTDSSLSLYSGTTNRAGNIELGSTGNSAGVANAFGRIKFFQDNDMLSAILGYRTAAGTDAGALGFLTQPTGGSPTERLTIDSTGNVGIASTSPYAKLSITNTGSGPSFVVEDDTSPDTTPFIIDATGSVGIGTSSPGTALSIGDTGANTINLSPTATSTFGSGLNIRTGCYAFNGTCLPLNTSGLAGSGAANRATFWSSASDLSYDNAFVWDNTNKRLGVGSSTPYASLSVQGGLGQAGPVFQVSTTTAGGVERVVFAVNSVGGAAIGTTTSSETQRGLIVTPSLSVRRDNGQTAVSLYDGNAGAIDLYSGTTVNVRFDANGENFFRHSTGVTFGTNTACGSGAKICVSGGATIGSSYVGTVPPTNGLIVQGLTGIGTTSPRYSLTVASSTGPQLGLVDGSLTSDHWTARNINSNLFFATSSPLTFATSTATALSINANGHVGIGTADPGAGLDARVGIARFGIPANSSAQIVGASGGGSYRNLISINSSNVLTLGGDGVITYDANSTSGTHTFNLGSAGYLTAGNLRVQGTGGNSNVGVGTTTPFAKFAVQAASAQTYPVFEVASSSNATKFLTVAGTGFGTTTVSGLTVSGSATSTSNVGWDITTGCYAFNGTCLPLNTSGLTGSGAANRATFWSSASNISYDDAFVWDNTNKRLGVATTTPFGTLSVSAEAGANPFAIGSSTRNIFRVDTDGDIIIGSPNSTTGKWTSGGSTVMLSIAGKTTAHAAGITVPSVSGSGLNLGATDGSPRGILTLATGIGGSLGVQIGSNTGNLNGGVALYSGSSGLQNALGIGTSTPSNNVSIYSATKPAINFSGGAGNYQWTIGQDISNGGRFAIASSSALGTTDRLVIDGAGNVGIGSTTPWGLLSVNANALTAGAPQFVVGSSTATNFIVTNGGNVGIGTASPATQVHIRGSSPILTIGNTSDQAGSIYLGNSGHGLSRGTTGANNVAVYTTSGSVILGVGGAASEDVTLTSAGLFGIGETSPGSKLSVSGNATIGATYDNSAAPTNGLLVQGLVGIATTSPRYSLTVASSTGPQLALVDGSLTSNHWTFRNINSTLYLATSSASTFATTSISALEIAGSGFGTTTVRGLNISGQATTTSNVGVNITAGCFAINNTCVGAGSGSGTVNTGTAGFLAYYPSDGTTVDDAGALFWNNSAARLGIGTTTPRYSLQVASSTAPQFAISDASLTSDHWTFRTVNNNLYFATSSPSTFATSTMPALTFNTNGMVGVGTTSPWAKFSVTGTLAGHSLVATEGNATSTLAGGLNVNQGALMYDFGANKTTIERLDTGPISFETNAGAVSWVDVPVTSAASSGTVQSYTAQIDSNAVLTIYGTSDGAGAATNLRVGIGTTTPSAMLSIQQTAAATSSGIYLAASDGDFRAFFMDTSDILHFSGGTGANDARLSAAGAWTNASDRAYKQDIVPLEYGLNTLRSLSPRRYNMKVSGQPQIGFIAQELELFVPEVVDGDEGKKGVSYGNLVTLTVSAIQEFSNAVNVSGASTTTASILSLYQGSTTPAMEIDALGNIAIGTSTNSLYKLAVGGDVAATGFINVSTAGSKTDITHLNENQSEILFDSIKDIQVAQYRYKDESSANPLRLGLIAEEAPSAVLSVDGKGVDLYKLSTLALLGVKEVDKKVDALTLRVEALEALASASSTPATGGGGGLSLGDIASAVLDAIQTAGVTIANGVVQATKLVTTEIVLAQNAQGESSAGSATIPAGETSFVVNNSIVSPDSKVFVTFNNNVGNSWYVSEKNDNGFTISLAAPLQENASFDYFIVGTTSGSGTASSTPPTSGSGDTEAPVVTVQGNNPATIQVGSTYADLGATVTDNENDNLGYTTSVDGVEVTTINIDTSIAGTHTITYRSVDQAGNVGFAERTLIIEALTSGTPPEEPPAEGGDEPVTP